MTSLPQAPRYSYAYSASALIMRTTIVSCRHSTNGRKAATPVQQNACFKQVAVVAIAPLKCVAVDDESRGGAAPEA